MVDRLVDFEFGVGFEVFPHGGFGVVAGAPGAVREHFFWEIFDDGVEDDAVTPLAYQRCVGFEFFEDMLVGVVAVEADQNFGILSGN